ncbi:hypothetical protein GCM10027413_04870 [Conyzicola nivalis]|uniref:Transmembrane protein n=1 Tax=Conyzicola nivalis TaxID=1477021 RepID=A0A916SM10_9MICO|nr:hypothetical protein [Conyzicola nivalis]GGB06861.1 hypothetical protein GCM10010979_21760 [Conyzicola nivalis]
MSQSPTRSPASTYPSIPDAIAGTVDDESDSAELRRILFSGTVWFAAAVISAGIPLSGLLAAGWRPADLPLPADLVWWGGAAIALIGVAGLGWAGCPVLAWDAATALKQKRLCIRGGMVLFLLGTVAASVAVLAVPA